VIVMENFLLWLSGVVFGGVFASCCWWAWMYQAMHEPAPAGNECSADDMGQLGI